MSKTKRITIIRGGRGPDRVVVAGGRPASQMPPGYEPQAKKKKLVTPPVPRLPY